MINISSRKGEKPSYASSYPLSPATDRCKINEGSDLPAKDPKYLPLDSGSQGKPAVVGRIRL
jgi:hypothetical protein